MAYVIKNPAEALSDAQRTAIERLQHDEQVIPPPVWLSRQAGIANDAMGPLSRGATVFCREGAIDWPNPEVARELCERYGINLMFTAPTAVRMWMANGDRGPARYDLSRLRLIPAPANP